MKYGTRNALFILLLAVNLIVLAVLAAFLITRHEGASSPVSAASR